MAMEGALHAADTCSLSTEPTMPALAPQRSPSRPEPGPTPCQGPLTQSGGEGEKPGLFPELFQQSS